MTERKLPNPSEYKDEKMTDKDWDYYFKCREKFDRPKTHEEIIKLLEITADLGSTSIDSPDMDHFLNVVQQIPATPASALAIKHCQGFKAVQEFNLYDAKQKYPDEF